MNKTGKNQNWSIKEGKVGKGYPWGIFDPQGGGDQKLIKVPGNRKPIVQSEVSQKEKDKYHVLRHVWILERWY